MNSSIKRSGVAAVLLLAASMAVVPAAGATAATADSHGPVNYVALGDSYAAGQGLATPTGQPAAGCNQTAEDYPHQLAAKLGYNLTDMTCSGAVTENISKNPQSVTDASGAATSIPVQASALNASTNIVTVTIGGNDAGFSPVIQSCVASSADGPVAGSNQDFKDPNCKEQYMKKGVDTLSKNIADKVARHLDSTFKTIKRAAPNAQIFVVGYPSLFPDAASTPAAGCYTDLGTEPSSVSFTATDVAYLHSVEVQLNQTMAEQAADAGVTFVDNLPASVSHSMCPQGPSSYINGIAFNSADTGPLVNPASLHPNLVGATFLATQTYDAVTESGY